MSMLPGRPLVAAWLALAALMIVPPSLASHPVAWSVPTYEDLIARLDRLPTTREAVALSEAAAARAQQARALPNPSIAYDQENVYGTGPYSGTGNAETSLTIKQPLELFGQRSARIQAARSEANTADLRREQAHWQVAGRLALAYAQAEAGALRLDLAAQALSLTQRDARDVAALVEQGREPTLRSIQAQAEVAAAAAALDEAKALRDGAFARLSAIAMLEQPLQELGGSLLDREPGATHLDTAQPLAVRIAAAERDTAVQRVAVERRRALPDVSASLGMRRFRETRDEAFTVGVELAVPLFDRNRGGVRAAHAEQRAAEARLDAQKLDARAERLSAEAALAASNSRARAADMGVVAAEEAYRLARIGFNAGRLSQLELRSTRAALIAAHHTAIDSRLARVVAEAELARLEGRAPFGVTP